MELNTLLLILGVGIVIYSFITMIEIAKEKNQQILDFMEKDSLGNIIKQNEDDKKKKKIKNI